MNERTSVTLSVNGSAETVQVQPRYTLADVLRHELGLTGTHVGCEHGICGACTVLVDGMPTRSCLMFAVQAEGRSVQTVESLGSPEQLSDLQRAFSAEHGLQCGFCTPGFLMLLTAFLAEQPDASDKEVREAVASNLCRCTGYQGIIKAACSVRDARRSRPGTGPADLRAGVPSPS
ncbi:MAG TPA: (2Fe-2S)-binding protein [Acidimicrobiales bacterium]|nr:(2Fe-2S)-binding protein [Acidimicrobiales bacterium]